MKLVFITVSSPAVKFLIEAEERINGLLPSAVNLKIFYAMGEYPDGKLLALSDAIKDADLTFVDLMGSSPDIVIAVSRGLEHSNGHILPYGAAAREHMRLGEFSAEAMERGSMNRSGVMPDMSAVKKMSGGARGMPPVSRQAGDMANFSAIMKYFKVADKQNIYNMLLLILTEYGGFKRQLPEPSLPRESANVAFCNPSGMEFYEDAMHFLRSTGFDLEKPVIVMLFYGHVYPTDTSGCIAQIKNRLGLLGNIVPVVVSGAENIGLVREALEKLPKKPDVILNFMSFRLSAGPMGGNADAGVEMLKSFDVPYLHPFFIARRSEREWLESVQGCTTSEVMISVMLPEMDGCIDTLPIGAASEPLYNEKHDVITEELQIIEERLEHLFIRLEKLLNLKYKQNSEKKVAIICYNYPPGESTLFGGAFLDTFASVANIIKSLREVGYSVPEITADDLIESFTVGKAVNSGVYGDVWDEMIRYPIKKCAVDEECQTVWGNHPGQIMADEKDYLIPGIVKGNVFIGLQPTRGSDGNSITYHDKTLPPHHQYIAFYRWLSDEFQADALIHVGTHGTLEFLKGKECGMSGGCYPEKLLFDTPHIYLYYCGNPAESTIAKRRSRAQLVGYQPPVFVRGGLYGEYVNLSTEIDNYHQSLALAPHISDKILERIKTLAQSLNLSQNLDDIEKELYRLETGLIPKGLHVFGNRYGLEERVEYAKGIASYARNGMPSLPELCAEAMSMDYTAPTNAETAQKAADSLVERYLANGYISNAAYVNDSNAAAFNAVLEFCAKAADNASDNYEMAGLIKSLDCAYSQAKLAGDIFRNPNVLPTGYNLFQFDPRLVPSATAMERGVHICENTLKSYLDEGAGYPQSVAMILWGLETSRTQGETFAQALSYLGVRLAKASSVWNVKYEIIPLEELNRPRIDITINICGFFRDMFPNLIESMDDILTKIANLDEPDEVNYFKAHTKALYAELINKGYNEKEAKRLSVSRMFGPREGEYGTGLTGIIDSKNWQNEAELGAQFTASLRHVYNRHMRGFAAEGLYEQNLKGVDIISQIRSSQEYEITDLDHYYEFFGGLAKSVENIRGKKVKMLISDTTNDRIETDSIEKSVARGIRSRVLNPKWIDGMLNHKFHGAQKIAERFENIMGLAATTGGVDEWIYNSLDAKYVEDEGMHKRMAENNPFAYMKILEQMMEYSKRGYWNASAEQLERIKSTYLELENKIESEV